MIRVISFVLLILLMTAGAHGQNQPISPCGTIEYLDGLERIYPGLNQHIDDTYHQTLAGVKEKRLYKTPPIDTTFDLPVVFHIVWNNGAERIPDSLIHSQIEVLNEAFNRQNPDTTETRDIFKPIAGNARIRFHLATEDPDGNPTNGITETFTSRSSFYFGNQTTSADFVKSSTTNGVDAWDTDKYLNIWVCDLSNNGNPSLLGYAFPPVGAQGWVGTNTNVGSQRQGVVLHFAVVGRNNPRWTSSGINTAEKTAVHEVGHFLGLRHTWGDPRFGQDGCSVDDFIDDTPLTRTSSVGVTCLLGKNTCQTANDLPDMIENYMDYSNGLCTNIFTKEQAEIMRYNLYNLRPELGERIIIQPAHVEFDFTKVFPNPTSGRIRVFIKEPLDDEFIDITLIDMLGRTVFDKTMLSDYEIELNTSSIAAGLYKMNIHSHLRGELLNTNLFKYD